MEKFHYQYQGSVNPSPPPTEAAKQLDDWRRKQEDLPGRPEAIRRLVELGLKGKK